MDIVEVQDGLQKFAILYGKLAIEHFEPALGYLKPRQVAAEVLPILASRGLARLVRTGPDQVKWAATKKLRRKLGLLRHDLPRAEGGGRRLGEPKLNRGPRRGRKTPPVFIQI